MCCNTHTVSEDRFGPLTQDARASTCMLGSRIGKMKNTYNLSLVRRRIQEALPRQLSAIGESALEAFLAVPGVSAWRPARFGLKELSYVFDIGLPFALIGDNPSVHSRRLRTGDAVRDGLYPDRCLWDEIHAAAILRAWGAQVCFAAQTTTSAAGLEVRVDDGETLEVEVLRTNTADRASPRARLIAVDVRSLPDRYEHNVGRHRRRCCCRHWVRAPVLDRVAAERVALQRPRESERDRQSAVGDPRKCRRESPFDAVSFVNLSSHVPLLRISRSRT